ncbi:hypothetical protein M9458_021300, partial [Cirrhinus mrigala]
NMSWSVRDEKPEPKMQVEWTAVLPSHTGLHLSEYLLEWVEIPKNADAGWQRVPYYVTNTTLN